MDLLPYRNQHSSLEISGYTTPLPLFPTTLASYTRSSDVAGSADHQDFGASAPSREELLDMCPEWQFCPPVSASPPSHLSFGFSLRGPPSPVQDCNPAVNPLSGAVTFAFQSLLGQVPSPILETFPTDFSYSYALVSRVLPMHWYPSVDHLELCLLLFGLIGCLAVLYSYASGTRLLGLVEPLSWISC